MSDKQAKRVRYFRGQSLRRQDFEDEQSYHVAQLKAHNISQHRQGVLEGLRLRFVEEENRFLVDMGKAVADDGTFVEMTQQYPIEITSFDDWAADRLDVFLNHIDPFDQPLGLPAGHMGCRMPRANELPSRIKVKIEVRPATAQPYEAPLIYLGRVVRDFSGPEPIYRVEQRGRELAGLVGATIDAPSGEARIELGTQHDRPDDRRFGVLLPKKDGDSRSTKSAKPSAASNGQELQQPDHAVLEIKDAVDRYAVDLKGDATISGDMMVRQGSLAFVGRAPEADVDWIRKYIATNRLDAKKLVTKLEGIAKDIADLDWILRYIQGRSHLSPMQLANTLELVAKDIAATPNEEGGGGNATENDSNSRQLPRPFTVYRATREADQVTDQKKPISDQTTPDDQVPDDGENSKATVEQLRIELEEEKHSQCVVGSLPAGDEGFRPILTVSTKATDTNVPENYGQVVVAGNLIVDGLIEGDREEPQLSEPARQLLFSGALLGPQNAEALIEAFEQTGFLGDSALLNAFVMQSNDREKIIDALLRKQDDGKVYFSEFAKELVDRIDLADADGENAKRREELGKEFVSAEHGPAAIGASIADLLQADDDPTQQRLESVSDGLLNASVVRGPAAIGASIADLLQADDDPTQQRLESVSDGLLNASVVRGPAAIGASIADLLQADDDPTQQRLESVSDGLLNASVVRGPAAIGASIAGLLQADDDPTQQRLESVSDGLLNASVVRGPAAIGASIADLLQADDDPTQQRLESVSDGLLNASVVRGPAAIGASIAGLLQADDDPTQQRLESVSDGLLNASVVRGPAAIGASIADLLRADDDPTQQRLESVSDGLLNASVVRGPAAIGASIAGLLQADDDPTQQRLESVSDGLLNASVVRGPAAIGASIADLLQADDDPTQQRLESVSDGLLNASVVRGPAAIGASIADLLQADDDPTQQRLESVSDGLLNASVVRGPAAIGASIAGLLQADDDPTQQRLESVSDGLLNASVVRGPAAIGASIADLLRADDDPTQQRLESVSDGLLNASVVRGPAAIGASIVGVSPARLDPIARVMTNSKNRRKRVYIGIIDEFPVANVADFVADVTDHNTTWGNALRAVT